MASFPAFTCRGIVSQSEQPLRAGRGEGEESWLVIGKDGRGRTDEKEEGRKKEEGTDVKSGAYKGEECLSEVSPGSKPCLCIFRLTIVWIRVDICQGESSEKDFVKKGRRRKFAESVPERREHLHQHVLQCVCVLLLPLPPLSSGIAGSTAQESHLQLGG